MPDNKDSRNQLKAFMEIKKGGLLQQWVGRLCVFSGTRLLIYKGIFIFDLHFVTLMHSNFCLTVK